MPENDISTPGFPNSGKWWGGEGRGELEILLGWGIFLPGAGNPRRSDFDDSNLFQS